MYKNEYYFIDKYIFVESKFEYLFFDILVQKAGFSLNKNINEHYYYNWSLIHNTNTIKYSISPLEEIIRYYKEYKSLYGTLFYVRVLHHLPLIIIEFNQLVDMIEDLKYETGMGWEAISVCGEYIIEFTDKYQSEIKINVDLGQLL